MPNTFGIKLTTSGFEFEDSSWGGNAFEGDTLSFSLDGLTGSITVSVYAGQQDSTTPSNAFLQVSGQNTATVEVSGTTPAQIAPGASNQNQYFTLTYTWSDQKHSKSFSVNTFLGMGTANVSPSSVEVTRGAILYFENATPDTVHLEVDNKHGAPSSKLFGSSHFHLSGQNAQPKSETVSTDAPEKTYELKQTSKSGASSPIHDTGSTISIKVGTSTPLPDDEEARPPRPR
ncbi:hypothetical protein JQX13_05430 [Archangium violaceum]|uniref:hypothetical protein n=1 Tax=Archangium violaceum TaxID=83451 RepID=UPI00193C518E|nr:hypothetical protein [Archangium violaceum]QRK09578.1 hypothetical protein JQX13_05430 [Archangium violaceum]